MPKIKTDKNSIDARQKVYAQLEAMGLRPNEIARHLGLKNTSGLTSIRAASYKKGYVQELQGQRQEKVTDLVEERKTLATQCFDIMVRKTKKLSEQKIEDISMAEIAECRKMVEVTEHTGRKVEAPMVEVNIKQTTQIGIQNSLVSVNEILEKSGLSLADIMKSANN